MQLELNQRECRFLIGLLGYYLRELEPELLREPHEEEEFVKNLRDRLEREGAVDEAFEQTPEYYGF